MPTFKIILQEQGATKAKKNVDNLNKSLGGIAKKAGIAAAGFVAVNKVFDGLRVSVEKAGQFQGVSTGFDNLRKKTGMSAGAFNKFNKALDGTVGSTELMTMANNAMLLGITESEDQMAQMFDTAQRLARAVGEDAAFGVNSLVTGIGRQSKLMLDNLGIMIDTNQAYEDYAKEIGVSVTALDDQQRKVAFTNAALEEAERLANNLGGEQLTLSDSMNQTRVAVENMAIAIGEFLAPVVKNIAELLTGATNWVTDFMRGLTETELDTTIRQLQELGVETRGLMQLENIQLNRKINELNNTLSDTKTEYQNIEDIQKRIDEIAGEEVKHLEIIGQLQANGVHLLEDELAKKQQSNNATSLGLDQAGHNLDVVNRIGDAEQRVNDATLARSATLSDEEQALVDKLQNSENILANNEKELNDLQRILDLMIQINRAEAERMNIKQNLEGGDDEGEDPETKVQQTIDLQTFELEQLEIGLSKKIKLMKDAGVSEIEIEKWRQDQVNKFLKKDLQSRVQHASQMAGMLAGLNENFKGSAKATARIQQVQALIDAFGAANRAITPPPAGYGPTPMGWSMYALSLASGLGNARAISSSIGEFALGGDFVTSGEQLIRVGDNPGGKEHVQITPLSSPNVNGPQGSNVNVNISGNVMSEAYTEDVIIPQIKDALRRGESI